MKMRFYGLVVFLCIGFPIGVVSQVFNVDTTFAGNGQFFPNYRIAEGNVRGNDFIRVLDDDKILMVGSARDVGTGSVVYKILPHGELDHSFNETGHTDLWYDGRALGPRSLDVQSDGKIIVSGSGNREFGVTRYTKDGVRDSAFGEYGLVEMNVLGEQYYHDTYPLRVLPDDKILLAGNAGFQGADAFIVRLNSDGTFDNEFGDEGVVIVDIEGGTEYIRCMDVAEDGSIIMAGSREHEGGSMRMMHLIKFLPNGQLDSTFSDDGIHYMGLPEYMSSYLNAVKFDPHGKIVGVGSAMFVWNTVIDNTVIRLNPDGSFDSTFNDVGWIYVNPTNIECWSSDLLFQPDGKIIVSGHCRTGWDEDICLYRINEDGTLDMDFTPGGLWIADFGTHYDNARALRYHCDRLLVAGSLNWDDLMLLRFSLGGDERDCQEHLNPIIPQEFDIELYPNPIRLGETLTLEIDLPEDDLISLFLYDVSGRLMQVFLNSAVRDKGIHYESITISPDLAVGPYFFRFQNNSQVETIKFIAY